MFHHQLTNNQQHYFPEEEDHDPSLNTVEHTTPTDSERLVLLENQLQEAHRLTDTNDKFIKDHSKKLYKLQYLLQHGTLPPTEPRAASGLNGISVGTALQHLLQSPERPLVTMFRSPNATMLSTLTCPYEMDPREGYSRWILSLLLTDALWTLRERECIQQAANDPENAALLKQAHSVLDHLDTWVIRATAALEGREFTGNRKPYIPGVGKILGTKQLNFREFIEPFLMKSAEDQDKYQHTTPMREWIQQTEQTILQTKRQEKVRKREEKASAEAKKRQKWVEAFEASLKKDGKNKGGETTL